jgi:hypothetical protein
MEDTNNLAKRDSKGHFLPGVSGNKGGRGKDLQEFKTLVRERSTEALAAVLEILQSEKSENKDRLKAAELVLNYAYGKPKESLEVAAITLDATDNMSVEQRQARIAELLRKAAREEENILDILD